MSSYYESVTITSQFIDDISKGSYIYGFRVTEVNTDMGEAPKDYWVPFAFDHVTKELKLILGIISHSTNSINVYYGLTKDELDIKCFTIVPNSILWDTVNSSSQDSTQNGALYCTISIDLSSWLINCEFRSMALDIASDEVNKVQVFDDEHFHFTGVRDKNYASDQYNTTELLELLQDPNRLNEKLNTIDTGKYSITDIDGFYDGVTRLLNFQTGYDTEYLGVDLEEVYNMNDYRVNLLGKSVDQVENLSRDRLNAMLLDVPTDVTSRQLGYLNLPNNFIFHNQSLNEVDLSTVTDAGIYRFNEMAGLTGGPTGITINSFTGYLFVQPLDNSVVTQLLYIYQLADTAASRQYRRVISDGVTSSWIEVIDINNLNTYITFDIVIRDKDSLNKFLANPQSYRTVAFMKRNEPYELGSLSLTGSNPILIAGYGATLSVNSLSCSNGATIRDCIINFSITSASSATILSGFNTVENIRLVPNTVPGSSVIGCNNCSNITGVIIDSSNLYGTFTPLKNCSFVSHVGYTDLSKRITVDNTVKYIDPYTCPGVTTSADIFAGKSSAQWYVSDIQPAIDCNSYFTFGATYVTNTISNGPTGVTAPVVIAGTFFTNSDGTVNTGMGIQSITDKNGNSWFRLRVNGSFGNWLRSVTEVPNFGQEYSILVKKAKVQVPYSISNFNSISLDNLDKISAKESVSFYTTDSPSNGPWGSSACWGKITNLGSNNYSIIASNGSDLAVGRYIGTSSSTGTVTWKYMSAGLETYATTSFKSNIGGKYYYKLAGLTSISNGKYIKITLPNNMPSANLTFDITIAGVTSSARILVTGNVTSEVDWNRSASYAGFDSLLVSSVGLGKSGSSLYVGITLSKNVTANVSVDVISSVQLNLNNIASSESIGDVTPVKTLSESQAAYSVTGKIGNYTLSEIFDGKFAKMSTGIKPIEQVSDKITLVGVSNPENTNGDTARFNANVTVDKNGRLNALNFNSTSALESKDNVKDFNENVLELIDNTKIIEFNFKGTDPSEKKIGFIADYTDSILAGNNHDIMDMYNCHGVTLKAIQELHEIIKHQSDEINKLKSMIQ